MSSTLLLRRRAPSPVVAPVIRRRTALPTPSPVVVEAQAPVRRMTTSNNAATRAAAQRQAREQIDLLLQSIAETEAEFDAVHARLEGQQQKVEALLRDNNIDLHTNGVYKAEIVETFTRQSRTIDPKKFKANVGDTTFWKVVNVPIAAAQQHLTEKELDAISDTVPARTSGYAFKLHKNKRKA